MTDRPPHDDDTPPDPDPPHPDGGTPDPEAPVDGAPGDTGYEATRTQRGAALVVAGGLLTLIAGTVVGLTGGKCLSARSEPAVDYACSGVVSEPWFGLVALVTVAAAAVGTALAVRDLTGPG